MRLLILISVFFVVVNGYHRFLGTNVLRPLAHHQTVKYGPRLLSKRIEYFHYTLPNNGPWPRLIQGILAYDLKNSSASANVTLGGVGTNKLTLRMKSERAVGLHYDIYIYE